MPLVSPVELATYLQQPVSEAVALSVIRVATGWLQAATGVTVWPEPTPDDLWAWTLELAAMAHANPAGAQSQEAGVIIHTWGERREQILEDAKGAYGSGQAPKGCFPPALPWPADSLLYW